VPKDDSFYIVQQTVGGFSQYIYSPAKGHYRITNDISQATHFELLSEAREASDLPGFWTPVLVLTIEPLIPAKGEVTFDAGGPPNVQLADEALLKADAELSANPDQL
jgi:hypothetical protein